MERKEPTVINTNATLSTALTHTYILRLIFQYLKFLDKLEPTGPRINKKGLLDIALTCKTFAEPALDILWESLDSLLPLLKLLPSLAFVDGKYTFRGLLSENDWVRFDAYACRVRTLSYDTSPFPLVPYLYTCLLQHHPKPLLPALEHFEFSSREDASYDPTGLFIFMSPSLSPISLKMITICDRGLIEAFLSSLIAAAVPLKEIVYQGRALMSTMMNILHFKNLESLTVAINDSKLELASSFFSMLDTLENLNELDIDVLECLLHTVPDDDIIQRRQKRLPFSSRLKNLKTLRLSGKPKPLVVILSDIVAIHLESVTIRLEHGTEPDECSSMLVRCLKYLSTPDSLQNVTFSHLSPCIRSCRLELGTVLPFWRLPELKSLKILHKQFVVEEEDVKMLAKSTPNLRVLELEGVQNVTFASLKFFAEFCQRLQHLKLTLERAATAPPVLAANFRSEHQLQSLFILGNAYGFDAIDTSRYLDSLFPYLQTFQHDHSDKGWEQTCRLIKVYRDVRNSQSQLDHFANVRKADVL